MHCRHSDCRTSRGHRALHFARHMTMGLGIAVVVAVVFGAVVMLCWNAIIPEIFNLPPIGFWQAVALLVLARLLTGRISHHGRHWRRHRSHGHPHGHHRRHGPGHSRQDREAYAQWWQAEGEAAFLAHQERQKDQGDGPQA